MWLAKPSTQIQWLRRRVKTGKKEEEEELEEEDEEEEEQICDNDRGRNHNFSYVQGLKINLDKSVPSQRFQSDGYKWYSS